jgi:Flp pilus assembly protein CpaB
MAREDVFLSVEWQVIAKLADDDLGDEAWPCDAANDRFFRRRRAHHAVLAVAACILRTHIHVDFQLGRHIVQELRFVAAKAILLATATTAGLFDW